VEKMAMQIHADDALRAFADRILNGEIRAGARAMRWVDDGAPQAFDLLRLLYPHTGRAHVVGITGNPGSGKSTLTDQIIRRHRERGRTVGVIAVDPSSPFSGGAILGDRIRMVDHATDDGVFIRSLATRGHLGGLSRSAHDVIGILDAMGFDEIIIETVGVGQDEIEVVRVADTSVVVLVPGMGDDIQALKAGILEIADIFTVNKADREGADLTVRDIRALQMLSEDRTGVEVPILKTVARTGQGVDELLTAVSAHKNQTQSEERLQERKRRREAHILETLVRDRLVDAMHSALGDQEAKNALFDRLAARETDPYTQADLLVSQLLNADG
jgi:LAO/AO transport system kinase